MYRNFILRLILSFITFLLVTVNSRAQLSNAQLDSLRGLVSTGTGSDKYRPAFNLAYELFDVDNQEALKFAFIAHRLSFQLGDSLEITKSGRILGQLLRRVDQPDKAIQQFHEVLPIAERNGFLTEEKRILNALALAYNFKAMYDLALKYNFRSLEVREKEGDKAEISIALNNIGLVYYKMGNFEQALEFYDRALTTKLDFDIDNGIDQLYINLSLCHTYLGNYKEAEEFANKGFAICGENCSQNVLIEGEHCLGWASFKLGNPEEAKLHFNKSYSIAKEIGDTRFMAENDLNLASIYIEQNDMASAIRLLQEAEQLALDAHYNQILIYTYSKFAKIYNLTKDLANEASYQSKYIHLKDSIYSEELIKNMARIQTDYEERENIKTIGQQTENIRLKEEIIDRQRQIYFFIAALAILAVSLAFVFFRYNQALSKAKAQLAMLNETLEMKVQERTRQLQSVNSELDNFIYKTSHDIRGPLASLKGIANVALLELEDPKAQDYLRKLDNSADKLNTILTRLLIVNQINHAVLAPMIINLEELINEIIVFERKKGTPAQMQISHEVAPDVSLITDRHLLRIILENLIDNAIKYHNNSERVQPFVKIKIGKQGDKVVVRVIDNGIGISERDPQKLFQMFVRASERSESGGIGLYLTKLASERLEASIDFAMTAEKHTQFSVSLPDNLVTVMEQRDRKRTDTSI